MWIVRLALRRPYTVATLCFVIFILGGLSVWKMRTDVLPTIDLPVVSIVWAYPGLSAEDMERRVVYITERALSTSVDGIQRVESQSIDGIGVVKVYFQPGYDIGSSIAQIAASCNSITRGLPPGMTPPTILRFNASNVPVVQLTMSGSSEQELFDYGLNFLRLRLFTVQGLSTPAPFGGRQREVVVDTNPGRLASAGLSAQDIVNAVANSNVILPAGSARIGLTEFDVALNGSPARIPDFNSIPVKYVGGRTVMLGDVAHVYDGYANQTNIVRVNGQRATYLSILKKSDASTLTVVDTTRKMLPSLKAAAPGGMELKLDFDQSVFVRAALMGVLREAGVSALLVSLMVLFFLGSVRSMVIVAASIPVAVLFGVVGLFLTGQTLNLMTLGGLALSIGMLVDDATVEVENIHRNRGMKKGVTKAILDGAHQVAVPALAATTTLCIVFFPVILLTGPARFLFIPLALAVVFPLSASYLLSRTLVPSLARKLMKGEHHDEGEESPPQGARPAGNPRAFHPSPDDHNPAEPAWLLAPEPSPSASEKGKGAAAKSASAKKHRGLGRVAAFGKRFNDWRDRNFEKLRERYTGALSVALEHRVIVLVGFGLMVLLAVALAPVVGLDFFPRVDTGQMRLHVRAPTGMRVEETERVVSDVEVALREIIPAAELSTLTDNIGVPTSYNLAFVQSDNVAANDAEIRIELKPKHHKVAFYEDQIRNALAQRFPNVKTYFQDADVVSQVLNFGLAAPIDVQVVGRNPDATFQVAQQVATQMKRIPGAVDVRINEAYDRPTVQVNVDRQRALALNVTERDVANSLVTSLSSSLLTSPSNWVNPKTGVNYNVVVQTPLTDLERLDQLTTTPVTPASGLTPPGGVASDAPPYVASLSNIAPTTQRASIAHQTVQPTVNVDCAVSGRDLGSVAREIERGLKQLKLPPGVEVKIVGQSESMFSSFTALALGMLLAVVLVYLLLAVLFQSWLDPLIIIIAVPGALVGILWMLALTGTTLNVESFMGAIMAVGIAVSNSILLVSFANESREEPGDSGEREKWEPPSAVDAAREAGRTRLRPVIMTALAMILGMLPMALAWGEGGDQNAPLGRAVIGGLLVATLVTLFVVPVTYSLLRKGLPAKAQLDEELERESHEGEGGQPDGQRRPPTAPVPA